MVDADTAALIKTQVEAQRPMTVRGQVRRSEELLGEVTTDEMNKCMV